MVDLVPPPHPHPPPLGLLHADCDCSGRMITYESAYIILIRPGTVYISASSACGRNLATYTAFTKCTETTEITVNFNNISDSSTTKQEFFSIIICIFYDNDIKAEVYPGRTDTEKHIHPRILIYRLSTSIYRLVHSDPVLDQFALWRGEPAQLVLFESLKKENNTMTSYQIWIT